MKHSILSLLLLFFLGKAVHSQESSEPAEVKRINSIQFAEPDGVPLLLDLYLPTGVESPPLLLFIHGGGWKNGDRKNCRLSWVAGYGFAVASVEYRLSQEALFPAQIHDCKGALRWLRAHADEYGYDASKVVVGGTSAGGHLAALLGASGGDSGLEGTTAGNLEESSLVQGIIDYYGPSDFVHRSKTQPAKTEEESGSVYLLLGGKVSQNLELARQASPITYVSEDDPPLLILHGDKDKTVYLDQSELLRDRYKEAGLDVTLRVEAGKGHGWKTPGEDEKQAVIDFLDRALRRK